MVSLIRLLLHLVLARPGIAFAFGRVSKFAHKPLRDGEQII
jgi:hypothetical protein